MIRPGLCTCYIADALRGVHHEDDRYMLAIYGDSAKLGRHCTEYTPEGEVSGPGYRAGGVALSGFDVTEDGEAVVLTFNDVRIERATITDATAALIYNASKSNRAVGVVLLAQKTSSTNGPFEIIFPEATSTDAVFVIE